ncbi:uncharacterized protein Z520_12159 [Fonsecaea multimorphosa CBS 102226]|uniref:Uncharacterized protein n=1 Tax=Fonsecaea multimorphosa CBS 102226 TaxID=1442371 RepID=A0A0D2I4E7_9EURO|nr:uncharacterized protein Z520_12159 [Fonsecaea multimorphosa CBS 102226]KIX92166.1 hypothetical protein Z520_12159 [Fonsecaea multimorphosa CBS 102226]OAL17532.1 hypothetical protein AYO22_11567 [Fonsecaea multimorphosa]
MFRHGKIFHKREPQNSDALTSLPSIIPNPTSGLPQSIAPSSVTTDPSVTASIVTAQAVSGLTTITETQTLEQSLTGQGIETTFTTERIKTITDPAEYASLTSAAAAASSTSTTLRSSTTSAAATSSAAAHQSSSNLGTLIPAIVVPIAVVLLASLGLFWFFMRRRHQRDLHIEPEFVMTGKGEKLSSRSSSSRSTTSIPRGFEKKSPAVTQTELPSTTSPPTPMSEWPSAQIGVARPLTPQDSKSAGQDRLFDQPRSLTANSPYRNMRGPGAPMRPSTSGRGAQPPSSWEQNRNRSNSTPGQRVQPPTSRSGPSPIPRTAPSPVLRSGPSPVPQRQNLTESPRPGESSAFRFRDPSPNMNLSNRAQAPSRLEAVPPGAFNGASSISQYSPIVKDTPVVTKAPSNKRPPPPIKTANLGPKGHKSPTSGSPPSHGFTEENLRIARLANSSRLGYTPGEPSPSPKLPPPATRSQLIPRESPKEHQDRFFGGSANNSMIPRPQRASVHYNAARASVVSDADDYEDIEAKSDVSSLNEFERFDFGTDINGGRSSGGGNSLTFFAAQNSPASERGSAFGTGTHERW